MKDSANLQTDRHILLFDKHVKIPGGNNVILMQDDVIMMGRQSSNHISLRYDFISRQHATFMKFREKDTGKIKYQIVDGGSSGRSTNGIKVNDKDSLATVLNHGDTIRISNTVNCIYINVSLDSFELRKYIDIISHQQMIDESTRNEISMVTEMFHSYSDTVLHTRVLSAT